MAKEISPFLMFERGAEAAMNFYVSLFAGAEIERLIRYGAEGPGAEGSVKEGRLQLFGAQIRILRQSGEARIFLHAGDLVCRRLRG